MILQKISDLTYTPKKIISVVPSQTELLYDLGLTSETIGISKFCIHPSSWFQYKTKVGGTKTLDLAKIKDLEPDLIIANKEENNKEQIESLAESIPVWLSEINNLDDAVSMIVDIGLLTGKREQADLICNKIEQNFKALIPAVKPLKLCYLIWRKPYMTVGSDTFIHDMITRCGFLNLFGHLKRYPEITIAELYSAGCDCLLLSSEPFPFKQRHIDELQHQLPNTKIILADGELFSWYGSRLLKSPAYFEELIGQIT